MNDVLVWLAAVGFAISVFPVHIYNYVYINTAEKYASVNAGIFKFNVFNANTVKNNYKEMQVNGKNKKISLDDVNINFYKIFNSLCLYKVIQLGDFGVENQNNSYAALAQYSLTYLLYKLIQINGNYCKLRNYTIINESHSYIRYYLKAVTVINLAVVGKILFIILTEKINVKIKKKRS